MNRASSTTNKDSSLVASNRDTFLGPNIRGTLLLCL